MLKRVVAWVKRGINRYDAWCHSMGLTPENKRSCCAMRYDNPDKKDEHTP